MIHKKARADRTDSVILCRLDRLSHTWSSCDETAAKCAVFPAAEVGNLLVIQSCSVWLITLALVHQIQHVEQPPMLTTTGQCQRSNEKCHPH